MSAVWVESGRTGATWAEPAVTGINYGLTPAERNLADDAARAAGAPVQGKSQDTTVTAGSGSIPDPVG